MDQIQIDRAIGAVVGSAVGDALGSQYEFGGPIPAGVPLRFSRGVFGHEPYEWTDDTSMAVPILQVLAAGGSLENPEQLAWIMEAWMEWARTAKDVGSQTRTVFSYTEMPATEASARAAALAVHGHAGQSAGNGSLMRTGPVALGYLGPDTESSLVSAAERVARLTHWEQDNVDACALWSLAIRHGVLTGELDVAGQVQWLPKESQERWAKLVAQATAPDATPTQFHHNNGWVVAAFQGALAAVAHAMSLKEALEAAIRGGGDTDTVAAIAGSLAGAVHGTGSLPAQWMEAIHGWPDLTAADLKVLVLQTLGQSVPDPGVLDPASVPTYLAEQIRQAELPYLAQGTPLMSRAARTLAQVAADTVPNTGSDPARFLVLVGPGNNGGDALYAAAHLANYGYAVTALPVANRMHEQGAQAAKNAGVTFIQPTDLESYFIDEGQPASRVDGIIDGILGTGTSDNPALRGTARAVVSALLEAAGLVGSVESPHQSKVQAPKVIAVDIPSGMHPDTGTTDAVVLPADVTVTFGGVKQGTTMPSANALVGNLVLADIGIGDQLADLSPVGTANVAQVIDARWD